MQIGNIKSFIVQWNNTFYLDSWYRKKYNIPFNSTEHRNASFIDIHFEYQEEKMIQEYLDTKDSKEKEKSLYETQGIFLRKKELSKEEIVDIFDDIDLSQFNKNSQPTL